MRNLKQDLEALDRIGSHVVSINIAIEWLERAVIAEEKLVAINIQVREIANEVREIRLTSTIDLIKELRNRGYEL